MLAEQSLWAWVFIATGRSRELVVPALIGAVINLAASVVLTKHFGLVGPLAGSTVAFLAAGIWVFPWRLRSTFGTSARGLYGAVLCPLVLAVAAVPVSARSSAPTSRPTSSPWASNVGRRRGPARLAIVFVLTPEDRDLWKQRYLAVPPRGPAASP